MTKINTVTIGSRVIDLYAFTGQVVDQNTSTYTESTVHTNNQVITRTDTYAKLFVRNKDGEERSVEIANMKIGVRRDSTVSLLWGIKDGKEKGDYVAVFNHDTNEIHHIRKGNNDLAGPPGYNMLLILAVIVGMIGVVGLFSGNYMDITFLAAGGGLIYWIYQRQKKLMALVDQTARTITP